MARTYPNGMIRRTHRKVNGKKRLVDVQKDPFGKESVSVVHKKTRMMDRTVMDLYGDATLTADQYNKYMDYYDWAWGKPEETDPEYTAWALLQKDYPKLKHESGFDAVDNRKYPYKLRCDGTILGYFKSEKEADRKADYITRKGAYYQNKRFKVEKVEL